MTIGLQLLLRFKLIDGETTTPELIVAANGKQEDGMRALDCQTQETLKDLKEFFALLGGA